MPWVRIKEGMRHRSGTLKGGDVAEVSEAEVVSFGDKFELLENGPPRGDIIIGQAVEWHGTEPEPLVTKAAKEYAESHGVSLSLSNIQGTGKDGRITLANVKAALQVENSMLDDIKAELAVAWSGEDGDA